MKLNIKSWESWAMVIGASGALCAIVAVMVHFGLMMDDGYHPVVADIMQIIGWTLFVSAMVLAVVAGRQFSVTWARRLFWLNLISLILFVLVTFSIWLNNRGWIPFGVKLNGGALLQPFQLSLFVCFWSFFFSWGMISRRTLWRQGFYILFVSTPPVLFLIWLVETVQMGPLKPG